DAGVCDLGAIHGQVPDVRSINHGVADVRGVDGEMGNFVARDGPIGQMLSINGPWAQLVPRDAAEQNLMELLASRQWNEIAVLSRRHYRTLRVTASTPTECISSPSAVSLL